MTTATYPAADTWFTARIWQKSQPFWQKVEHWEDLDAGCDSNPLSDHQLPSAGLLHTPCVPLWSFWLAVRDRDKSKLAYWWSYSDQQLHAFLTRNQTVNLRHTHLPRLYFMVPPVVEVLLWYRAAVIFTCPASSSCFPALWFGLGNYVLNVRWQTVSLGTKITFLWEVRQILDT